MIRTLLAGAIALLFVSAASASEPAFRVAVITGADAACAAPDATAVPGARAYLAHLAKRLERAVLLCPRRDAAAAARLIADGGADLASLTPDSFPLAGRSRAILAARAPEDFGRAPMVASVRASSAIVDVQGLKGKRAVVGGRHPVAAEGPFRTLSDFGVKREDFAAVEQLETPEAAIASLRAGEAEVMLLHASAHRRLCRGIKPEDKPCGDLRDVWTSRARPAQALVAPLSLSDEVRYRLIGIHIALHLEAPEAFAWLAPKGAPSFDPAEAGALAIGR